MSKEPLYLAYTGTQILKIPSYNKGSAFSEEERKVFNLQGIIPHNIETIDSQLSRVQSQFALIHDDLQKHIFLRSLQDNNETLFYRFLIDHLPELMPLIYTPVVGEACLLFSKIYRQPRGLFLSYPNRENIADQIWNAPSKRVKVIVITDGERILGLGDLGANGMGIPIGKLSLYTGCGGINPISTLPILIDVGTNNQTLLDDPMYIGWKHKRIVGEEYFNFLDDIMALLKKRWPGVLIQFEDFSQNNATNILSRYRDDYCCFNDDIQGTAAVSLAALLQACNQTNTKLQESKIVIAGAGSAGVGIANLILGYLESLGFDRKNIINNIYLTNSKGLLCDKSPVINDFQTEYVKDLASLKLANKNQIPSLEETVLHVKPSILIGVSGIKDIFSKNMVESMAKNHKQPIIFPLSNPTSNAEGAPENIINWSQGSAIVATGSPFKPVTYNGKEYKIAQCNNSYIFPGLGLGLIATNPAIVPDSLFLSASLTVSEFTKKTNPGHLLPKLNDVRELGKAIAFNAIKVAIEEKLVLEMSDKIIKEKINSFFWEPEYREYRRAAFL